MNTWKGPGMAIAVVKDDKQSCSPKATAFASSANRKRSTRTRCSRSPRTQRRSRPRSLAILVDEKKLAWDDKVSKYLPDFQMYDPWVTSELTIRDIVSHRVGLDTFSGDLLWYDTTYPTGRNPAARAVISSPFRVFARVTAIKT